MRVLHRVTTLCLLSIFLLSIGCATPPAEPKSVLLLSHQDANKLGYTVGYVRSLAIPDREYVVEAEILGDLLVVIESPSQLVTALDINTGEVRWRFAVPDSNGGVYGPYRFNDLIGVNTDLELFVLDAHDGRMVRKRSLGGSVVQTKPAMSERFAIFGGIKGRVFAIDITTGLIRWDYKLDSGILTPPLARDNTVFVADANGVYAMINDVTGEALWRGRAFDRISAQPASDSTRVYVPSEDQGLYALARTTGRDQWTPPFRTTMPLTQSPFVVAQDVILPLPGEGLVSLRAANGQENWRSDLQVTPLFESNGHLLTMGHRELVKLNLSNGYVLTKVPTQRLAKVLSGPNNTLILVSRDGRINQLVPMRSARPY